MTFPYVRHVRSNVKGGVDRPLGPRMVFTGPNGAGKSAIISSIELALTGTASDIIGRASLAREVDLLQLAPGGNPPLECIATLSDGAECQYVIPAGAPKGKSKRAVHTVPSLFDVASVFPLRGIREAVVGSVDTQRRWWLQQVGTITDAEIRVFIPEALQGYYTRASAACLQATPPVDKLVAALAHARTMVRTQKAEARASIKASGDAGQGLAAPPAEGEIDRLRAEHRAVLTRLEGLAAIAQAMGRRLERAASEAAARHRLEVAVQGLGEARQAVEDQATAVLRATAEMTRLEALRPAWKDRAIDLILALDELGWGEQGPSSCPCCGVQDPDFISEVSLRAQDLRQQLTAGNVLEVQREEINRGRTVLLLEKSKLEGLKLDSRLAEGQVEAAQKQLTEVAIIDVLGDEAAVTAGGDPAELRRQAQDLSERLAAAEAAESAWAASKSARDQGLAKKRMSEEWSDLVEACQDAVDKLLGGRVKGFVVDVCKFLPPSDAFDLVLQDGTREVCAFGLRRGGVLHTALSGGEWARVLAAIAAAKVARAPDKLAVIIPEDRAWDPATLAAFLSAVRGVPAQVIVATTTSVEAPGWTVERIGGVL